METAAKRTRPAGPYSPHAIPPRRIFISKLIKYLGNHKHAYYLNVMPDTREARMKRDARRQVVDKVAAAVMLQSWLENGGK